MTPRLPLCMLTFCFLCASSASALPRDAEAVLNRCGKPLKGDLTVLDNSVAGGHRTLSYERGTLYFDRYANDGWSFTHGDHGKEHGLNAAAMQTFMPCLKDALSDSAAPVPLKAITPLRRVEVSAKRSYKLVILAALAGLAVLWILYVFISRRVAAEDDQLE